MSLEDYTVQEIGQGIACRPGPGQYQCLVCGKQFESGEIYAVDGRLFTAARAAARHMECEHPEYLSQLIDSDSKYNSLTANQQQLLKLMAQGRSDKEIAQALCLSPSTVRHQRFIFREKAKQAKLYLAIYEQVFQSEQKGAQTIMPIHDHAKMVDERFVITEEERAKVLKAFFSSEQPLKLKELSSKEKKKVVILSRIAEEFERGKEYSEKEVNQILGDIHEDYATLRRYLIEYGFMDRSPSGGRYWLMDK